MLALAALLAFSTPPPTATAVHRPRVLVMDFRNDGVDAKVVAIIRDALTAELAKNTALDVLSTEDMRRSLDVEAQKAAVGCTDDQCMVEIANALGADYIVFGNIGTLGDLYVGNMSLLDAKHGTSAGRESIEVHSLEDLPAAIRSSGAHLADVAAPTTATTGAFASPLLYAGAGAFVGGAALCVVGAALSAGPYGVITDHVSAAKTKDDAVSSLNVWSTVAIGSGVIALAGAGAVAWAFVE